MPQLHMYVPESTAEALRRRASDRGMSVSGYLAELVGKEVGGDEWPERFFEEVLGSWEGDLARRPQGEYEERESLTDIPHGHCG